MWPNSNVGNDVISWIMENRVHIDVRADFGGELIRVHTGDPKFGDPSFWARDPIILVPTLFCFYLCSVLHYTQIKRKTKIKEFP